MRVCLIEFALFQFVDARIQLYCHRENIDMIVYR